MSHMLGSSAADSLIGTGCRADPTRVLHRADVATAGCSSSKAKSLHDAAVAGRSRLTLASSTAESHDDLSADGSTGSDDSCDRRTSRDSSSSRSSKVSQGSKTSIGQSKNQQLRDNLYTNTNNTTYIRSICTSGSSRKSKEEPHAGDVAAGAAANDAAIADGLTLEGKTSGWLDREAALMMAG